MAREAIRFTSCTRLAAAGKVVLGGAGWLRNGVVKVRGRDCLTVPSQLFSIEAFLYDVLVAGPGWFVSLARYALGSLRVALAKQIHDAIQT
jgi:hypothetical protein